MRCRPVIFIFRVIKQFVTFRFIGIYKYYYWCDRTRFILMFYINEDLLYIKFILSFFVLIKITCCKSAKLNNCDVIFLPSASCIKLDSTLKLIKQNLVFYKIN